MIPITSINATSGIHDLSPSFSIRFRFGDGQISCEWFPRMPDQSTLNLLGDEYRKAEQKFADAVWDFMQVSDGVGAEISISIGDPVQPVPDAIDAAISYIESETGIALTPRQFTSLFGHYPELKAHLVNFGWGDSTTKALTLHVIALTYLGRPWPIAGEDCDMAAFAVRLQAAAADALQGGAL